MRRVNELMQGDCLDYMRGINDESVDLVIADPPYYKTYGGFDFVFKDENEYLEWTRRWVSEAVRCLKPTGALYVWGSDKMIDKVSVLVLDRIASIHKRNLIVWNYQTGRPGKKAYRNETEFMWFYSKDGHVLNIDDIRIPYTNSIGHDKDKRKNPLGKSCGNVWVASRIKPNYPEWVDHPTQKPLEICDRIVKASSCVGDTVLIPFAGSGSEIVSCMRLGRNWLASEIDESYCDLIKRRIDGLAIQQGRGRRAAL